jgi:serine/threonine protein phosphatase PrpC
MSEDPSVNKEEGSKSVGLGAEPAASSVRVIDISAPALRVTSKFFTRKNKDLNYEKPIEDFHMVDSRYNIFILMDGATRYVEQGCMYPDPSPAANAARNITRTAHQILTTSVFSNKSAKEILLTAAKNANDLIRFQNTENFPQIDYLENDYANACGIIGYIKNGSFHYAYLGDPQGYLIRDGKLSLFTVNQTSKIEELYSEYSKDKTKSLIDFRKLICGEVRNNREHPHAFGTFTGEDRALDLIEFGELPLQAGDRIILTSDGLLPIYTYKPEELLGSNYEELFDLMEALEAEHNIRSDDKTLIAIDIS